MSGIANLDVCRASVTTLAEEIANGGVTPSEILESYAERIHVVEDRVHAWSHTDLEAARATATRLSEEAKSGKSRGPLHGIPFGIKDEFYVEGMPTYFADPDGRPQPRDATAVARLREAGAIILGKTHMPIGGKVPPTRNPWNLAHTAGGTSSGSGAAVAARMVPTALGEQTAGSNLRPAAFCGVAGLKPTFGRISRFGCYQFSWSFDHVGIIGLTMADIGLVLAALNGPDPLDRTAKSEPPPSAALTPPPERAPAIGLIRNFFPERTQPVMQAAIERAALRLNEAGATVTDVLLPNDFGLVWMVHRLALAVEASAFHSRLYAEPGSRRPPLRDRVAAAIPASYYLHAQRVRHHLWQTVQASFHGVDAILLAAAAGPAPEGTQSTGDASLLVPWSCLGYPAITINGGLSPEGLPLGLQFVGAPWSDTALLRTGGWCEEALGRLRAPQIS